MINSDVKKCIEKCVLCWLATSDMNNMPNVTPKEIFTYKDEFTLLIANIASPNSIKNILSNQNVCVSFVDIFVQKGFKLKGEASIINKKSDSFSVLLKILTDKHGTRFPIKSIISISVNEVKNIIAPSYFLFPETTEQSQIESAMSMYHISEKKIDPKNYKR